MSVGAAGSGQKSRLRAARPPARVCNRPPGQSDREAQESETGTTSVTSGQGPWEEGSLGTVRGGQVATEAYRGRGLGASAKGLKLPGGHVISELPVGGWGPSSGFSLGPTM